MLGKSEIIRIVEREAGVQIRQVESLSGGSISTAKVLITCSGAKLFLKSNPGVGQDFFAAEAINLTQLKNSGSVDVPEVVLEGSTLLDREGTEPFIVLEYIEPGESSSAAEFALGVTLARLHSKPVERFGFIIDNFIGSMPQKNTRAGSWDNWGEFFFEERLKFQARIGQKKRWFGCNAEKLLERKRDEWIELLNGGCSHPALVHGDLWGGNVVWGKGRSVLIDPACYWGCGESDLAMTQLFGGFGSEFYRGYWAEQGDSKKRGFEIRARVLNLYHLMNHANIFGGSYIQQVNYFLEE